MAEGVGKDKTDCKTLSGIPLVPAYKETPEKIRFSEGPWHVLGGIQRSQHSLRVEIKKVISHATDSCVGLPRRMSLIYRW